MEQPERTSEGNTTENTADETARTSQEDSPTVMPDENAEDQERAPSPPPPGSGPGGA